MGPAAKKGIAGPSGCPVSGEEPAALLFNVGGPHAGPFDDRWRLHDYDQRKHDDFALAAGRGGNGRSRYGIVFLVGLAVGLLHAAARGKEFSESVARAKEAIWSAAESAATRISNHDARVLEPVRQVDLIADRLKQVTPGSIQVMIDDAAGRKAAAQTAQLAKERGKTQAETESLGTWSARSPARHLC